MSQGRNEQDSADHTGDASLEIQELEHDLRLLSEARTAVGEAVVGQNSALEQLLVGLISGGHTLLEGAPGLGKTLLVKTLAEVLGLEYSRVQFTPDLMPADVTGTLALTYEDGSPVTRFQRGPIFAQLVLADEINRATPKTQAALLEAMQEQTVTVAGQEHRLPQPFFVLATQNPFEMDGTYTLPEAQIDRFLFKVLVDHPSEDVLVGILDLTTGVDSKPARKVMQAGDILRIQRRVRQVPMASHTKHTIARFVRSTQPTSPTATTNVKKYVRFGISPRGAQALVLAAKARALLSGRFNASLEDVRAALEPALRHRVQLNYQALAEGVEVVDLLADLFKSQARASTV
jgi:MoxR-like ATPase